MATFAKIWSTPGKKFSDVHVPSDCRFWCWLCSSWM